MVGGWTKLPTILNIKKRGDFIELFFLKLLDNFLSTLKTIFLFKNKRILSALMASAANLSKKIARRLPPL